MRETRPNIPEPQKYLRVPLHKERLGFETVGLEESIREFIWLTLITRPGSFHFDPEFGCHIWDQEFQYIKKGRFKEDVQKAVQESVERYETRLKGVRVDISVRGFEDDSSEKRLVEVWVKGVIKENGRNFEERFEIDWDRGRKYSSP